jgi:hypothetical protein
LARLYPIFHWPTDRAAGAQPGLAKLLARLYPTSIWPTNRAVGAQPGLAKLLARLYPASHFLVIYFSSKLALS